MTDPIKTNAAPTKPARVCLLGAIAGDVIGSAYEYRRTKRYDFQLFTDASGYTDDSLLTIAVAEAILSRRSYMECVREYARAYPDSGFGGFFYEWIYSDDPQPYHSYGNGSAMRASAVGWAFDTLEDVLREAEASAAFTHDHPEGIKGAQATALAVFLARKGESKERIKQEVTTRFDYDLERTLDEIRPTYRFDETCQRTVPEAIIAFLESVDFEDAVRKAVSLGGDADTLGAITGAIAEAFYGGVPEAIVEEVRKQVPGELWEVVKRFSEQFAIR